MEDKSNPEGLIDGSYTISLDIAGRRVQVGGYIQRGQTKDEIVEKMNIAQDCIDHQLIRADLRSQEGQLKGELAQLEQLLEENAKLLKAKEAAGPHRKLHTQDEAKLRAFGPNTDHLKLSIEYRKKIILKNCEALGLGEDEAKKIIARAIA
jgi:hypothetical protein